MFFISRNISYSSNHDLFCNQRHASRKDFAMPAVACRMASGIGMSIGPGQ